jgi:hypothetical protein
MLGAMARYGVASTGLPMQSFRKRERDRKQALKRNEKLARRHGKSNGQSSVVPPPTAPDLNMRIVSPANEAPRVPTTPTPTNDQDSEKQ